MASEPVPTEQLTDREREVLDLMARGLTNGQIAEHLEIGFETAKTHVSRIIAKTGAGTREEAVERWRTHRRPIARMRRNLRALWAFPAVKIGAGVAGVAAIAVVGLLAWQGTDDHPASGSGVTVDFWATRGGETLDIDPVLPFEEAIRQQEELTRLVAPVPTYLPGNNLRPLVVNAQLPPEHIPVGLAIYAIAYGDSATSADSSTYIGIERTGWYAHDENEPVERSSFGSPVDNSEWDEVFELADGALVTFAGRDDGRGLYVFWHPEATAYTQMNVRDTESITHDEAIRILQSLPEQD